MGKVDDALMFAKQAVDETVQNSRHVQASTLLVESLIVQLRNLNLVPQEALESLFMRAAKVIDDADASSEDLQKFRAATLAIIEGVAVVYGVRIPPPGAIVGSPKKH